MKPHHLHTGNVTLFNNLEYSSLTSWTAVGNNLRYRLLAAMDFIECYLCGDLAVQEHITRDLTVTIFCTNRICGRYDLENLALQTLKAGGHLKQHKMDITSQVYIANRKGERILITADYVEW